MSTERSKAAAEIHSLVQGILESEKNANNLVDLLDYLQVTQPEITFVYYIIYHELSTVLSL